MRSLKTGFLHCLTKKEKGDAIEQTCYDFLRQQKIVIIERNFRSKFGEIDLIGIENKDTVIFFEIRYRQHTTHGSAAETVNYTKQQRIVKTALFFLSKQAYLQKMTYRFDIIGASSYNSEIIFNWQKNAFQGSSWI